MQASKRQRQLNLSVQDIEAFYYHPNIWSLEPYCTFESSSGSTVSVQEFQSKPRITDPHDINQGSPFSGSYNTDDVSELRHKLRELETAMLGTDSDEIDCYDVEIEDWRKTMEAVPVRDLKHILLSCAKAVSYNDVLTAEVLMAELRKMVSVSGDPIQRLGAYMLEGLVARLASSGSSIYKSLRCKDPESSKLLSYMNVLYEVCPYFKFGYMSANGAIAEALKDEKRVHIIDFHIGQGSQWVSLIQAFAGRPGGPPRIRITGIDDATSAYARGGGLDMVGNRLDKLAKHFNVPFEFNSVSSFPGSDGVDFAAEINLRSDEVLAVNFAFMLHHMPDESVSTENHRDRILRRVRAMNPRVVTLVEQESNTNTAPFFPRFVEAMEYYRAMFESMDVTLERDDRERINVEQHCLARDLVNIIACEGRERVERHEPLGKWISRFRMAGFEPYPLSSLVNSTIKRLLENYSDRYRLQERDGGLFLGWMTRDLVASRAWKS
jgi:hypothetical protein